RPILFFAVRVMATFSFFTTHRIMTFQQVACHAEHWILPCFHTVTVRIIFRTRIIQLPVPPGFSQEDCSSDHDNDAEIYHACPVPVEHAHDLLMPGKITGRGALGKVPMRTCLSRALNILP